MWQKKRVWQVTTIIQLALCHLVTSHFQEIACNYTPKGQIRWPIFLLLLCMIVFKEITSKFSKPIIFRILVFSCHKMTLITKITWMPQHHFWTLLFICHFTLPKWAMPIWKLHISKRDSLYMLAKLVFFARLTGWRAISGTVTGRAMVEVYKLASSLVKA